MGKVLYPRVYMGNPTGRNFFDGYGYGMVLPDGYVPVAIPIDDILIFDNNINVIKKVKDFLSSNFEINDLEDTDVFLNIKLLREGNGVVALMQSYYVEKLLSHFGYSDRCTFASTPYDLSVLVKNYIISRD
jgi:hypothetical protein